ncbi:MAG: NAD(P)-dependent dehydrogenase (short-subunit alcohol dehydrogenase family) [Myxococcota bacterium]|jgi:NAD(P)-dependent dehydrogenase (short-subunit alcohol dehydrogenase family)
MSAAKPWVVILGASSGFGAAAARAYAKAGHPIFGAHMDRRNTMPAVEALIEELKGYGVPVLFHNGNAAGDEVRATALDALTEAMGDNKVGVVLHSLAFGTLRPFFDERAIGRKHMEMTLDVMANSLVYWTQDIVKRGLFADVGRVFAMTSSGSLFVVKNYGAVSAAKSALESHIRQLALELAPLGITANGIMAGVTHTPALDKIPGADRLMAQMRERNPSKRLTTPEDVAQCLLSLSEPGTQWMTGNILRVDGGETIAG